MWLVYANTIHTIVYMHTCAGTIEIMNFLLTNQITAFQTAMIIRTSVSKQSSSMTICLVVVVSIYIVHRRRAHVAKLKVYDVNFP